MAAGALEQDQRLYRVLYKSSMIQIEDEITIHVKAPEGLKDFFAFLVGIGERTDVDPKFQQACADLLREDPWLCMFVFTNPTDIPPRPDIASVSDAST